MNGNRDMMVSIVENKRVNCSKHAVVIIPAKNPSFSLLVVLNLNCHNSQGFTLIPTLKDTHVSNPVD